MSTADRVRETLIQKHQTLIEQLEKKYANYIYALSKRKIKILIELQKQFYKELHRLNHCQLPQNNDVTILNIVPKSFSKKNTISVTSKPISLIPTKNSKKSRKNDYISDSNNIKSEPNISIKMKNNKTIKTHSIQLQSNSKAFKCNDKHCSKQFDRNTKLKKHKLQHTNHIKPFECNKCRKRFKKPSELSNHKCKKKFKLKVTHKCNICQIEFTMAQAYAGHMNKHRQTNPQMRINRPVKIRSKKHKDRKGKGIHLIQKGSKLLIPDDDVDINGKQLNSYLLHTVKEFDKYKNSIVSQIGEVDLLHMCSNYYIVDCNVKCYKKGQMVASRWPVTDRCWRQFYIGTILKIENDNGNVKYHVGFHDGDDIVSKVMPIVKIG
eukprot:525375_1